MRPISRPDTRASSPLVLHHGALGDTIQLTAMLQALSLRWGVPCDVLAGPASAPRLLSGLDFVGDVHYLGTRKRPYFTSPHQWRLVEWLRAREPSPVYVVERWRHPVAPWSSITRLESLLRRAGIPNERIVTTRDCERQSLEHVVDFQLRMARIVPPEFSGEPVPPFPDSPPVPRLETSDEETAECRDWLAAAGWRGEPLILLQTEARRTGKRGGWPRERWLGLARAVLNDKPDGWILLLGAPAEHARTRALAALAEDPRVRDVARELPLRRLFALLGLAHSMISLDTGPAQAAAALGCPVVVLAGTADPRRNRPLGTRVKIVTAWGERPLPDSAEVWFQEHHVRNIRTDDVLEAWSALEE